MLRDEKLKNPRRKVRSFRYSFQTASVSRRRGGASGRMFLLTGSKGPQGGHERRTIYQKIREYDLLEKKKTVTALKPGEDRAILLGLIMILSSLMMYFLLGITMVRSYSDSVWTEESSCTVLNSTITAEMNCTYSCGSDCWRGSKYPCLQVFVSLNASGKVLRLSHNEETQEMNPECFYVPKCRKDHMAMHTIVMNISERLKMHQQVPCYYDPDERQDSVILTRLYSRGEVFHSLLWPSCMLLGGTLIILMVKLTQYLSILCEQISKVKR
ncbi:calcium-activated potassium channel subunit beta-2-like isoform X1 [Megalops cyprinoides]|uniref:calcium-activated potassium channel subunit beta-2-like isoform X1 n=2 Tax=Megalops cyprinoides TaxID=118141 RepID=UPI00186548AB|nr:calcium-activated potassium channel subunit beta-2-like isoform X1 [Megalops cyprinoides]